MQWLCSERILQLPRSGIRRMFDLAAKHPDAIHLCMGEPDFATPSFIIEAAFQAAKEGKTHYTPNAGFLSLRRAVAEKYKKEQGAYYDPEGEVLITVGAMEALVLTLMSILNSGDEVIIPDPYWPNYQAQVLLAEGKPVFVPLYEEGGWILTADRVLSHLTPRCRAIIINSPHNPTGSVYGSNELQEIVRVCKENDILIISDEAYEKIIYDGEYHSICSLPEMKSRTIVINTFSKTYAMTGWRVGYVLGPEPLIREMTKLQENVAACASSISQEAALTALKRGEEAVMDMLTKYRRRRAIFLQEIEKTRSFSCCPPRGTFYAFVNVRRLGDKSEDIALRLLKEAKVVTVPGSAFGSGGEGYLRFSFATSEDNIREAFDRIRSIL